MGYRYKEDSTDIYYTWQLVYPEVSPPLPSTHLTTFQAPSSTYKSLSIPLPGSSQPGQQWRLGLFSPSSAAASSSSSTPGLLEFSDEPGVLGVWSEGIKVVRSEGTSAGGTIRGVGGQSRKAGEKGKGKGKGKEMDEGPKQGRIQREWSLPGGSGREGDEILKIVEQTSFDLDKVCHSTTVRPSDVYADLVSRRSGIQAWRYRHGYGGISMKPRTKMACTLSAGESSTP
jgi:hypothetical protein